MLAQGLCPVGGRRGQRIDRAEGRLPIAIIHGREAGIEIDLGTDARAAGHEQLAQLGESSRPLRVEHDHRHQH